MKWDFNDSLALRFTQLYTKRGCSTEHPLLFLIAKLGLEAVFQTNAKVPKVGIDAIAANNVKSRTIVQ